ncbi:unnamed protein product [Albugo candida]|uniref:Uncharacterized protein n=1 Tax=Albugo candida TaxID=65357 RepID=A0A024GG35_9STRA|nr:unnamed protein product [Albugo candida]|eukprot:CCI45669.1 unnamed protein product [Albugo candida]
MTFASTFRKLKPQSSISNILLNVIEWNPLKSVQLTCVMLTAIPLPQRKARMTSHGFVSSGHIWTERVGLCRLVSSRLLHVSLETEQHSQHTEVNVLRLTSLFNWQAI